ncbi:MAG: DUF2336 domain-containing protein [Kiloniellales bacterium]|nr:DUF2336 domain-containing protein [Kiloniellales bacterium]
MNSSVALSKDSVKRLLSDPSPKGRAETAASVAKALSFGSLGRAERQLAGEILELLARDLEVAVRQAVAEHAKSCPFLPRNVACRLAADVEAVALPLIRYSSVLTDDDLIAVIEAGTATKLAAVAARDDVTSRVSDALIATRDESAVRVLLGNDGARISETGYGRVIADFGALRDIQELLVARPMLPLSVTERLIAVIAEDLYEELISRQELPPEIAAELIRQGSEKTLAQAAKAEGSEGQARELAKRLKAQNRLTPTLLLRALCLGDLRFFEAAMALQAGIPFASAHTVLQDGGPEGFRKLYRKTGLPEPLLRPFLIAIELIQEVGWEKAQTWRLQYTHVMLERLSSEIETSVGSELEAVMASVSRLLTRDQSRTALN